MEGSTRKDSYSKSNESLLLHRNGFEEERIEALLHKIEIQMKHQSTNFGLSLASVRSGVSVIQRMPVCVLSDSSLVFSVHSYNST